MYKILKYLAISLSVLLGVLTLIFLLVQLPTIQTYIGKRITKKLSSKLKSQLQIKRVNIDFFKTIVLEEIYIEDQLEDTLIFANSLSADIRLFSLFNKQISVQKLQLKGAAVKFSQNPKDSSWNYDFLIQFFEPSSKAEEDKEAATWTFGMETLALNNVQFQLDKAINNTKLSAKVGEVEIKVDTLALKKKIIDLKQLSLDSTYVYFQSEAAGDSIHKKEITFPASLWDISIEDVQIVDNHFVFNQETTDSIYEIDLNDLSITNISGNLSDFFWEGKNLGVQINQFSLSEKSGFWLEELTAQIRADSQHLVLENLLLKTPNSLIQNTTFLSWEQFSDVFESLQNVEFNTTFNQVELAFRDLKFWAPTIEDLQLLNTDIPEKIYLSGQLEGDINELIINDLNFNIGNLVSLGLEGILRNPTDIDKAAFDFKLKKLNTSYQEVKRLTDSLLLPIGLEKFGAFQLSGIARGQFNDFNLDDFYLSTESNTFIKGNAYVIGLPSTHNLRFDLIVDTLITTAKDWNGFGDKDLPPVLEKLGKIQFIGIAEGDLERFELVGDWQTDIGSLETDLMLHFATGYHTAKYAGELRLINFELDKAFPKNKELGIASLYAVGQGSGFQWKNLLANAKLIIDSIDYHQYRYRNLMFDGQFAQQKFDGTMQLVDKNAELDFQGSLDLSDTIPDFNFVLHLEKLHLQPLNFTKEKLSFSFDAAIDLQGNKISNLAGKSLISDIVISGPTRTYKEDELLLTASQPKKDSSHLSWQSEFLQADINGQVDVSKLPRIVWNYVNDYFPIYNFLDSSYQSKVKMVGMEQQNFDFEIYLTDPTPLTLLFLPKMTRFDETYISGFFNRQEQKVNIDGIVDLVEFANVTSEQVVLKVEGTPENLRTNIALLDIHSGAMSVPLAIFESNLRADSSHFTIQLLGDTLDKRLNAKGIAYAKPDWYEAKLIDQYVLNSVPWQVAEDNAVKFKDKNLIINNLSIKNGTHQIVIESEELLPKPTRTPPIIIDYTDFEIADVTNFVDINPDRVKGLINGKLTIKEPAGNLHYLADLTIKDLRLNDDTLGQFFLLSNLEENRKTLNLTAGILGRENQLGLDGQYFIDQRQFSMEGSIEALRMRLLNPFTKNIIRDSKGLITGDFKLSGSSNDPQIQGQLGLQDASTVVDYLGTKIAIPSDTLQFDSRIIHVDQLAIKDELGQQGKISGQIHHRFFKNYNLDLQFQSPSFKVLNTTAEQNSLFFGEVYAAVFATVRGSIKVPDLDISGATLANTVFNLQPLTIAEKLTDDDYILFTSPEKYEEAGKNAFRYRFRNAFNLNLLINMNVTPDALVRIIIDPTTDDLVEGRGQSNMGLVLSRFGGLKIFGDFELEEGQYNFSYRNLIKKKFEIEPNSMVSFNGNPLNARFDITANYLTKTSTYPLIKNETNLINKEAALASRSRTDVKTKLFLKGPMTRPEINFDIQLVDAAFVNINDPLSRKMNELRNDIDEMNKQVFSLLLFNSFLASENVDFSLSGTGQRVALSSVSQLISNQLNQLATRYVKGMEFSFDLASYQSNLDHTLSPTILGLGISQRLFNDRLTFKADADINLSNQRVTSGSNIVGDFILEYQLTPRGNYLLRVFHLSEFDILTDQNTGKTGVGINVRKSFGNVLKVKEK